MLGQVLFTEPDIKAAREEEKIIDVQHILNIILVDELLMLGLGVLDLNQFPRLELR